MNMPSFCSFRWGHAHACNLRPKHRGDHECGCGAWTPKALDTVASQVGE
jgi:hypothetical protein